MGAALASNTIPKTTWELATLVDKLKRTLARLRLRRRKPAAAAASKPRAGRLQSMPRCSSFAANAAVPGGIATLILPTKRPKRDPSYTEWKNGFEAPLEGRFRIAIEQPPIPGISEALSGQVTPRGFPSHSDLAKMNSRSDQTTPTRTSPSGESLSTTRCRLSLRLPLRNAAKPDDDTDTDNRAAAIQSELAADKPRREMPRFLSKIPKRQALVVAQLYQEIKDLEEYYGTRLDYYYL